MSMLCALLVLGIAAVVFYWKSYLLEPRGDPFTRGPFVTRLTEQTAELRWRVKDDVPVTVRAVGEDGSSADARGGAFSGLTPGTRYAWTAAVDGVTRASGSFRTAPVTADARVTFAVVGDYGSGSDHEYAVGRVLAAQQPDFVLTAGGHSHLFGAGRRPGPNHFPPVFPAVREGPLWGTP